MSACTCRRVNRSAREFPFDTTNNRKKVLSMKTEDIDPITIVGCFEVGHLGMSNSTGSENSVRDQK